MMSSASLTHKRLAALVPAINEAADGSDQVADAGEAAAADRLPGDDREEHLDRAIRFPEW